MTTQKKKLLAIVFSAVLLVSSGAFLIALFITSKASEPKSLIIHYQRSDSNYYGWNLWMWEKDGADIGGVGFSGTDNYGKYAVVECNPEAEEIGFIIRCSKDGNDWADKDGAEDRYITVSDYSDNVIHVYVISGKEDFTVDTDNYATIASSKIDGKQKIAFKLAHSIDEDSAPKFTVKDSKGNSVKVGYSVINDDYKSGYVQFNSDLDFNGSYTLASQNGLLTQVTMVDYIATSEFEEDYCYNGDDLGANYSKNKTTFKVWAPTAQAMSVNLYSTGKQITTDLTKSVPMTLSDKGVWVAEISGNLDGTYYMYKVKNNGSEVVASDPYAKSAGINGTKSMVIDLASAAPSGWNKDTYHCVNNITDAIIYELHVRDFSSYSDSGIKNKGKFSAFAETGTHTSNGVITGLDYLADLGINYVHLLPIYDYATVDETTCSDYNWGYDPVNYNVPEGSYSSNPTDGHTRVTECRQMVQALHSKNIGVVMDSVFNHTYSKDDFSYEKLMPGYYFRPDSNGSGCGNDAATERYMVSKYVVDSVKYWANTYHIDGFRFDLMGLLDVNTMNTLKSELQKINSKVIVYGEGWNMDYSTRNTSDIPLAHQGNSYLTKGVSYFCDNLRDSVGGNNDITNPGYVSGSLEKAETVFYCTKANTLWSNEPTQKINYVSCHDNYTIWDKICSFNRDKSENDRIKQNLLSAAIVYTSQGTAFTMSGEEFLRTKTNPNGSLEHNSYRSPDSVNMLDYSRVAKYSKVYNYYKGLIAFRKAHKSLRMTTIEEVEANYTNLNENYKTDGVIAFQLGKVKGEISDSIIVIYNPNTSVKSVNLPSGNWQICVNAEKAGTKAISTVTGKVNVTGLSCFVLVKGETDPLANVIHDEEDTKTTVAPVTPVPVTAVPFVPTKTPVVTTAPIVTSSPVITSVPTTKAPATVAPTTTPKFTPRPTAAPNSGNTSNKSGIKAALKKVVKFFKGLF